MKTTTDSIEMEVVDPAEAWDDEPTVPYITPAPALICDIMRVAADVAEIEHIFFRAEIES